MAVVGLCCCTGFSPGTASKGCCLVIAHGLLFSVAYLVAEHGLQGLWPSVFVAWELSSVGSQTVEHRLNRFGTWAHLIFGLWNRPGSGIEPVSPTLAADEGSPVFSFTVSNSAEIRTLFHPVFFPLHVFWLAIKKIPCFLI